MIYASELLFVVKTGSFENNPSNNRDFCVTREQICQYLQNKTNKQTNKQCILSPACNMGYQMIIFTHTVRYEQNLPELYSIEGRF